MSDITRLIRTKPSDFIEYDNVSSKEIYVNPFRELDVTFTYETILREDKSLPEQHINVIEPRSMLAMHLKPGYTEYRGESVMVTEQEERIHTFQDRKWKKEYIGQNTGVLGNFDEFLYKRKVLPSQVSHVFIDDIYRAFIKHNPGLN